MITTLRFNNFKGQTRELALGPITAISGPNGSGKSTVWQAVDFALTGHVRNDGLGKDLPSVFGAYAGSDAAEVSVELETDDAHRLARELKRTKRGSVSTSRLDVDGQAVSVRDVDLGDQVGIRTFNATAFWSLSGSKQIAEVARIAGLDPEELERLDNAIEAANHAARLAEDRLRLARGALDQLRKDEQAAARPGDGMDLSRREERIKELRAVIVAGERDLRAAQRQAAEAEDRRSRCEAISAEIELLAKERSGSADPSNLPDTAADVARLEARIRDLEGLEKLAFREEQVRLELSKEPAKQPTPPAYTASDVARMDQEIAAVTITRQAASDADRAVMDVMRKIWARVRPSIVDTPAFLVCQQAFLQETAPHSSKIEAEKQDSAAKAKLYDLREQREAMAKMVSAYDRDHKAYMVAVEMRRKLEEELSGLEAMDLDGLEELPQLRANLASARLSGEERRKLVAAAERRGKRMDDLLDQLEKMSGELTPADPAPIQERIAAAATEIANLEILVRADEKWRTTRASVERAAKDLEAAEMNARAARAKERELLDEKAEMVATLKGTVEEIGSNVVAPASLEMEIIPGRNGGMRLWLHLPGGRRVLRQAVSGAEGVEMDVAISAALMGGQGVITAEASEISAERLGSLVGKLRGSLPAGTQVILTGHDLASLSSVEGVTHIAMALPGASQKVA